MPRKSECPAPGGHRPLPTFLRVSLVLAAVACLYGLASGGRGGNEIDSHRLIVAQCWNALEGKLAPGRTVQEQTEACQRMERGFALMYGSGA